MIKIKEYNQQQRKILEEIEFLDGKINQIHAEENSISLGSKRGKLLDKLLDKINELDPLRSKDNYDGYNTSMNDSVEKIF